VYLGLDWLSYVHPVLPLGITPWNPPPGLSVALLLSRGLKFAPALVAGPLLAEIVVRGIPAPLPYLLASSLVIALGYSAAVYALARCRFDAAFARARDVILYLGVMALTSLLVALAYIGIFRFAGLIGPEQFASSLTRYWIGDFNGVLVFAPALLALNGWRGRATRFTLETLAQGVAIGVAFWIIFGIEATDEFKFFYLLFLPLIWIAMRHGIRGTALGLAVIQLGLIVAVQTGGYQTTRFIEFQFLMLTLCVAGLLLGATVTQRKQAEQELFEKQVLLNQALRLAAAGEMTSALAHELNNPIAALSNYTRAAQLLLENQPLDQPQLRDALAKAVNEAHRAGDVVHRLRDLFRSGGTRLAPVAVNAIVNHVLASTAARAQRHYVRVRTEIAADLPLLLLDSLQIETVLHNLVNNAIDALSQSSTDTQSREREILIRAERNATNGWVYVSVRDNGPGIPPEVVAKLFEPFNTSKAHGMGLGLAISRNIARAHGGELRLEHSGRGATCFILSLPPDELNDAGN
jgi:signal transduction histidine kinase